MISNAFEYFMEDEERTRLICTIYFIHTLKQKLPRRKEKYY